MRVLVSAYACEPSVGSERGAGWAWASAAAERHDVWLLTRRKNRAWIDEVLRSHPGLAIHPVYVDLPRWASWWKRGGRGLYPYYVLWQVAAGLRAHRLHREIGFDVAHHLTFALDWLPAGVCFVPGLPAIWGPVGGATVPPRALWRWLGVRGAPWELARAVLTGLGRATFGRATARRSARIVAQNDDVDRFFADSGEVVVEQNVALDQATEPSLPVAGGRHRAVFVGRLVRWKGVRLAVAAIAQPEAERWHLDVFGDGPERAPAARLAEELGVAARVTFHGAVARRRVLNGLRSADALLFPSLHDAAGWAVAEALAQGCPVVALDVGGPRSMVPARAGVRVAPSPSVVGDLARALATVPGRVPPTRRWRTGRLPALLDEWYAKAAGRTQTSSVQAVAGACDMPSFDLDSRRLGELSERPSAAARLSENLRFMVTNPRLVPHAAAVAVKGAAGALNGDPTLGWLKSVHRVRRVQREAILGAEWGGAETFVQAVARVADPSADALEIGCGGGRVTRRIRPLVGSLVAVDVSEPMLAEARYGTSDLADIDFRVVHGFGDDLDTDSSDLVVSHDVFVHFDFDDAGRYLSNIRRALRPGGTAVLSVYTLDTEDEVAFYRRQAVSLGGAERRIRMFPACAYERLLETTGFDVVATDRSSLDEYGPDKAFGHLTYTVRPVADE